MEIEECRVIAVTAYSSRENEELCMSSGMYSVLNKPVSLDMLREAVAFLK